MPVDAPVVVIGAGIGGLTAAATLAAHGLEVVLVERAAAPGGKMRTIEIAGRKLDAGPTVFTLRAVFEEIFADAGASLDDHLALRPVEVLARHAWSERERLDLFADLGRSAEAIGAFAGPAEARGYRQFCARARKIYQTLEEPFIRAARPANPLGLAVARRRLGDLRGSIRSPPCGGRWVGIFATRGCARCSGAMRPTWGPRRSKRRRP